MSYYRVRKTQNKQRTNEPIVDGGFLCHYGIKGQKWGVRRFQEENGTLTAAGRERYGVTGEGGLKAKMKANMEASARDADKRIDAMAKQDLTKIVDREKSKQGDTSDAKTRLAFNVVSTLISPFGVLDIATQGAEGLAAKVKTDSYFKKREKNGELDSKTGLYMKREGEYNERQDLAAVNPGFHNFNSNTKNNCMLCTTTYDLRQRGYDVTAQLDSEGYNFGDLKRWYPKAKFEKSTRVASDGSVMKRKEYVANTIKKLESQGDGARGNLMVFFNSGNGGGGHSLIYEVQNGKLVIKDSQANIVYKNPQKILRMTEGSSYARLDNVEPDMKRIKAECVR